MVSPSEAGDASNNSPLPRRARPKEAARYLKIGRSTLFEWCKTRAAEGFPQPLKLSPRVTLFDLDAIEKFIRGQAGKVVAA